MLIATNISLVSCDDTGGASLMISADTYIVEAGETLDVEKLREMFVADTEPLPDTTASFAVSASDGTSAEATDTTDANADEVVEGTVYWVTDGGVWHRTSKCRTLSHSKNIHSGKVEEAMLAGKSRLCKVCGN